MLLVCRRGLKPEDFTRLEEAATALNRPLRWSRRGGRLILRIEAPPSAEDSWRPLVDDPAVEFVLEDPSEGEITRLFSRRDLLDLAIASTGVLATAAVGAPLLLYLSTPPEEKSPRGDRNVGPSEPFAVNSAKTRLIDGEEFLIIRRDEEHFHALSATCTHSEVCLLSWSPERRQVICPCHQGVFDIYGNVVSGPPPRPLEHREVVVRDGQLYVRRTS